MNKKKNRIGLFSTKLSGILLLASLLVTPVINTSLVSAAGSSSQSGGQGVTGVTQGAQQSTTCKTVGCEDPVQKCTKNQCDLISNYVTPAINLLAAVFGAIAVSSVILGGIQYSTSEGDPQKSSAAKKRIENTLIAVVAFLFLYAFLQFLIPGGIFNR